jgi:hypothetical protein
MNSYRGFGSVIRLVASLAVALGCTTVVSAVPSSGDDQNADSATLTKDGDSILLSIHSGRPVFRAVLKLQEQYGYVITYEDPPYRTADDLNDVAPMIHKDYLKFPADQRPTLFVPKSVELNLKFPASLTTSGALGIYAILTQLVQTQNNSGKGGHFRVEQVGNVFHVIPIDVRDRNGNWTGHESLLDTPISLPNGDRTEQQLYQAIAAQVATRSGVQIHAAVNGGILLGRAPPNPDMNLGASNELARDVLTRVIESHTGKRTWALLHTPEMGENVYHLNIMDIPRDTMGKDIVDAAQAAHPVSNKGKIYSNPVDGSSQTPSH